MQFLFATLSGVSTSAGGLTGTYASLVKLNLTFPKKTKKVRGKTVSYASSVACKGGKRTVEVTFTAENGATAKASDTQKCS